MFETRNNGFWITFDNGFRVSVQFGYSNYCENRDDTVTTHTMCKNAEIAVFDPKEDFVPLGNRYSVREGISSVDVDNVFGWVSPEEVAGLLMIVSTLKSGDVFTYGNPLIFRG